MLHSLMSSSRWVGAVCALAVLGACGKGSAPQEPVRAVKVLTVGESGSSMAFEFSGDVRARVESSLSFRVAGKLLSRPAEIGQRIKPGALLAQLDPQDYSVTADAAAAQLVAAQATRDVASADVKRYQDLHAQGFISLAELQRHEAAYVSAQAQWKQAQAQSSVQSNQSGYTRLLADGAGIVTSVDASAGQVVAPGQPVVRLALDGPRDVVFSVAEDKLGLLKTGTPVKVRQWVDGKVLDAVVRDVSASADSVTRSFMVKAALPKDAQAVLGSTVTVYLSLGDLSAVKTIKLPTSALRMEAGAASVWVLDPSTMTVKAQAVEVNTAEGNDSVVTSGLQNGDQVVLSGVHVLTPGQKVSVFGATK
ncbi:efflux RND transporter periplasmic adaptor subunit [Limnohabitans sp.]|uniref:efflux RND transporter periplasmic adaptor subunit n=1 Tax=Limnohabitans sp. TaxID=1907725 RepID=UPI00286F138C|nr:efflux RND transporter periplasmic adaptor subunit [Limnohabitans sp.]